MTTCPDCGGIGIGGCNAPYQGGNEGTGGDYSGMDLCQTCHGSGEVSSESNNDSDHESD